VPQRAGRGERLAAGAGVDIALMVISELLAREGAVVAGGLIEHGHMRRDAMLISQPAEHLGRAVGAVAEKAAGIEIEAINGPLDHPLCRQDLGLPDRGRCFDINDDRVVDVDQIVGRVGKERLPAMGSGPARRRIGEGHELRRHPARPAKGSIVEHSQILLDRSTCGLRWEGLLSLDPLLAGGIRLDQACIACEGSAPAQPLLDPPAQDRLENPTKKIALTEAAMPVLAEGGVIGDSAVEPEPTEPSIGQIEMNLLAQPPLRTYAEAVAYDEHSDHQLG